MLRAWRPKAWRRGAWRHRAGWRAAGSRIAAASVAVAAGLALPLLGAGPARADQVQQAEQWVLNAMNVPAAWHVTKGHGVTVAVIDSGVNPAASDIAGSIIAGPDLTKLGTPPSNPGWGVHGTWMASLIVGHGHGKGGTSGVIGVAPQARVLSIRVITDSADPAYQRYLAEPAAVTQQQLAAAIRYAVDHGAGVLSMSLGYGAPSLVVRSALQYALQHNVVVVASSGNDGGGGSRGHNSYSFPADYLGVLGVGAVDQAGQAAYFSSQNLSVQVAAPGVSVPAEGRDSNYWLVSGTSPACALTAGVAALIRSRYPGLSAALVRQAITSSTSARPAGGYNYQVGFGTVNAAAALVVAGRLAGQAPASSPSPARAQAGGYFGGGPAAVPAAPVAARSLRSFIAYCGLAVVGLILLIWAVWMFAPRGRGGRSRGGDPAADYGGAGPGSPEEAEFWTGTPGEFGAPGESGAPGGPWAPGGLGMPGGPGLAGVAAACGAEPGAAPWGQMPPGPGVATGQPGTDPSSWDAPAPGWSADAPGGWTDEAQAPEWAGAGSAWPAGVPGWSQPEPRQPAPPWFAGQFPAGGHPADFNPLQGHPEVMPPADFAGTGYGIQYGNQADPGPGWPDPASEYADDWAWDGPAPEPEIPAGARGFAEEFEAEPEPLEGVVLDRPPAQAAYQGPGAGRDWRPTSYPDQPAAESYAGPFAAPVPGWPVTATAGPAPNGPEANLDDWPAEAGQQGDPVPEPPWRPAGPPWRDGRGG